MELIFLFLLIATGLFAGCMSGIPGVGGGFIFAPVMYFVLQAGGVPADAALLTAFGTSLAAALPTVLTGAVTHTRQGNVIWRDALIMGIAGVLTGFLGGVAATHLPVKILTALFGLILILGAVRLVTSLPCGEKTAMRFPLAAGIGGVTGFFSGLLGVGGGTILVPLMTMLGKFSMKKAAATSSAAIVFITIGGISSYLINGYFDPLMWVILAVTAVPAAAVSAKFSEKIPDTPCFAGCLPSLWSELRSTCSASLNGSGPFSDTMYGDELRAKTIIYTAVFAALITVGGWISLPVFAIPFTLQTLFVLLAAAVMKERAVLPVLLYLAAGLIGLPVFHNGAAGAGILLGPSGGFLLGFIPAAAAAGYLFRKRRDISAVVSATLIADICGMLWFMLTASASLPAAFIACVLPYIPGDILKGAAALAAAKRLRRILHD